MKLKHRHIVNEHNALHLVNAYWIYGQLPIYTCLDTLALMHFCPDIVAIYAGNNMTLYTYIDR